jgi:hypothetical protein
MKLEQCQAIRFLHFKCLKLDEIAVELSNTYDRDAHTPPSINIGDIESSSGEPISKRNMLGDDRFSMI